MPADPCPWCAFPLPRSAGATAWRVERCPACRVGVTRPWPDDAQLDAAYAAYRPAEGRFGGPLDAVLRRSRATLAARIDRLAPPGPVLDIGAGDGTLVAALRDRGRQAIGLERTAAPVPHVHDATVAELDGPFGAIVLWHALEHLRDPAATLAAAAQRLQPGGVLVVAVPDLSSLQARVFGARWLALDLPRHLVHLPGDALVGRLRELGLAVERRSAWRGGQAVFGWLHGLVGAAPGHPDLYDALRRPAARMQGQPAPQRVAALVLAALLTPVAAACAAIEIALGHGGSIEVEARRHP
ncbi:MAG TPA: class I SAM-dependent methyltransferase [Baekduia sp.]|nr:class I SAM-dependent methyltransferase [Baekduia sp.]